MGLRINTNTASLNAQRVLWGTKIGLDKSMEKLASGFRINRAGDDAAGLAISENLKAQVRGLKQASRNAQDGISLVQVAEGSMNEISGILIRLRELSVQAASDTVGPTERQFLNVEYDQLVSEIDRISEGTEFNGTQLLAGVGSILDFQVGTRNNPEIDRISFDASKADANSAALGVNLTSVADKASAQNALAAIDQAIVSVSAMRADFGAIQNRLQSTVSNIQVSVENMSAANSRIRDVDVAEETSEMTRNNILLQAGTSVLAQANQQANVALGLLNKSFQG
ncbi:flagellin [Bdellovibrio sp. HCB209]|uniref:flagellin N-terminal helical domain-containing protein n=1 Tax=Bdellovibrio sp. HCB209 TaxID=3394354 RepID=UPI0039B6D666